MQFFKTRPLCGVCFFLMLLIFILSECGVPLLPEEREKDALASLEEGSGTVVISGRAAGAAFEDGKTMILLSRAVIPSEAGLLHIHGARIYADGPVECCPGQTVTAQGELYLPEGPSNPGQFDAAAYWRLRRISAFLYEARIVSVTGKRDLLQDGLAGIRKALLARVMSVYPSDTAGIVAAMLLGERDILEEETMRRYEEGGIAHVLVISSLHLHLLGMAVYALCRRLRMPVRGCCAVSFFTMLFYVTLTGWRASSARAFAAFFLFLSAKRTGRTYDALSALSAAAILLLLTNPYYLFYSSFRLSFGAAGLILLARGHGRVMGTLMVQAGIVPIQLYDYYVFSVLSLPVNLLLVPLLPAVLAAGAVGLVLGGPAVYPAVFLLRIYDCILGLPGLLPRSQIVLGRPSAAAVCMYYALFLLLAALLKLFSEKRGRFFFLLLLIPMGCILACGRSGKTELCMLDVGQGDAVVLRDGKTAVLIDGGSANVENAGSRRIEPFLLSEGIGTLEAVLISHTDDDHINGTMELLARAGDGLTPLVIRNVVLPLLPEGEGDGAAAGKNAAARNEDYRRLEELAARAGANILYAAQGDTFSMGGMHFRVLLPRRDLPQGYSTNEASMVLSLSAGPLDVLLTGDLEGRGESDLTEVFAENAATGRCGLPHHYEVLKTAHHGSGNATGTELLRYVRPDTALISAGRRNVHGHPHAETLERLQECGAEIFVTKDAGAITVTAEGNSVSVRTFLGP